MSRKLNEIKTSLNSQIQNAITAVVANTVLPFIQNTLEIQGRPNFNVVDRGSNGLHPGPRTTDFTVENRRSSGLQRNHEVENSLKTWENCPKMCFTQENSRQRSRESSADSYTSEQNRDNSFGQFVWFEESPYQSRVSLHEAPIKDRVSTRNTVEL